MFPDSHVSIASSADIQTSSSNSLPTSSNSGSGEPGGI